MIDRLTDWFIDWVVFIFFSFIVTFLYSCVCVCVWHCLYYIMVLYNNHWTNNQSCVTLFDHFHFPAYTNAHTCWNLVKFWTIFFICQFCFLVFHFLSLSLSLSRYLFLSTTHIVFNVVMIEDWRLLQFFRFNT